MVGVELSCVTYVVVCLGVDRGLARGNVFTLEGVICDVLSSSEELFDGVFQKCSVGTVHVERNRDSPAHFHISYV